MQLPLDLVAERIVQSVDTRSERHVSGQPHHDRRVDRRLGPGCSQQGRVAQEDGFLEELVGVVHRYPGLHERVTHPQAPHAPEGIEQRASTSCIEQQARHVGRNLASPGGRQGGASLGRGHRGDPYVPDLQRIDGGPSGLRVQRGAAPELRGPESDLVVQGTPARERGLGRQTLDARHIRRVVRIRHRRPDLSCQTSSPAVVGPWIRAGERILTGRIVHPAFGGPIAPTFLAGRRGIWTPRAKFLHRVPPRSGRMVLRTWLAEDERDVPERPIWIDGEQSTPFPRHVIGGGVATIRVGTARRTHPTRLLERGGPPRIELVDRRHVREIGHHHGA